jgi:predicted TIM-barrel fold metal-dependent hydrolase
MQHFNVDEPRYYPLFEEIAAMRVPVMIDVGMTGMGAGTPGGMSAKTRHAHPASIDALAANFPQLTIIMAHPGYPWIDETTAVALHKGNVYWEMSGWAPKYLPAALVRDMRGRLQDKVMFGSDYPSIPYDRLFREWENLDFPPVFLEKFYARNAERVLGL